MNNSTFKADIFIIPNSHTVIKEDKWMKEGMSRWNQKLNRFGFTDLFTEEDTPVQIWTASEDVDSWNNHGAPDELLNAAGLTENIAQGYFPETWPARVFAGMKEGDTITLLGKNFKVELTARQLNYRYKNQGRFESVLRQVQI